MVLMASKIIFSVALFMCTATITRCVQLDPSEMFSGGNDLVDCPAVQKIVELANYVGLIKYRVHKYDIRPDMNWDFYIQELIKSGKTETLKHIDTSQIGKLLTKVKDITIFTIFLLEFEMPKISASEIRNWVWKKQKDNEVIKIEIGKLAEAYDKQPGFQSKKEDITIEFIIGPKISKVESIDTEYFFPDRAKEMENQDFILIDPTLDTFSEGKEIVLRYGIFLCASKFKEHSMVLSTKEKKQFFEIMALIDLVAQDLANRIKKLGPKLDLGLDYAYHSSEAAISLQDDNLVGFIRRWVKPKGDYTVVVNLYKAVKRFVSDHLVLSTFKPVPHKNHELEAYKKGKHILIVDKFYDTNDLSGNPFPYRPYKNPHPEHIKSVDNRVKEILGKVEKEGLDENEMNAMEKWFQEMMKEDFEKHRKAKSNPYKFHTSDQHFAYRSKVKFRPVLQPLGPPFGVGLEEDYEEEDTDEPPTPQPKPKPVQPVPMPTVPPQPKPKPVQPVPMPTVLPETKPKPKPAPSSSEEITCEPQYYYGDQ